MPSFAKIYKALGLLMIFGAVVFALVLTSEYMDIALEHVRGDIGD